MLLGLEGERVGVDTGVGVTRVMVVGLHLVEILAVLLLEAILTVEDELEVGEGTDRADLISITLLAPLVATPGTDRHLGSAGGSTDEAVGIEECAGRHDSVARRNVGGEIPKRGVGSGIAVEAPHKLLDGVVIGKTDLLLGTRVGDRICTSVLNLLDQVLVTLLGEAAALLSVQVDIVAPHLETGGLRICAIIRGELEVKTNLVVLEGDEGEEETGVAVEEENEGEVDLTLLTIIGALGGETTPVGLLGIIEVKLGIQTPPTLVVLIDALTTNGKLDILNGTLGRPATIGYSADGIGSEVLHSVHLNIHLTDEVTVASNSDGYATTIADTTVDGLLDVLHRKVGVVLVHRLEEGHLGVTREVNILSAISYELH